MDRNTAETLLREMQENCRSKALYKDEKAELKAEAIEFILKSLRGLEADLYVANCTINDLLEEIEFEE